MSSSILRTSRMRSNENGCRSVLATEVSFDLRQGWTRTGLLTCVKSHIVLVMLETVYVGGGVEAGERRSGRSLGKRASPERWHLYLRLRDGWMDGWKANGNRRCIAVSCRPRHGHWTKGPTCDDGTDCGFRVWTSLSGQFAKQCAKHAFGRCPHTVRMQRGQDRVSVPDQLGEELTR